MKIAAAQISCVPGEVETNLRKIVSFAEGAKAAGATLVAFPEMADTGYVMSVIRQAARPWSEGVVPALQELAKRLSLAIICGVSERVGGTIYNSQVLIDSSGQVVGRYRKTHLFCAGSADEKECFTAGNELQSYDYGEFRLGLSICYDLRFPEIYRKLATEQAANVFIISSAWPFPRLEHLRVLCQARAIENQSYLVLANRVGTDERLTFCGASAIIDPSGAILACASSEREKLVMAELSQETLETVRERMAVFAHRRNDLYGRMAAPESAQAGD
jgi:predicted amidohydrolase